MFVLKKQEPEWHELIPAKGKQPAVSVQFAPATRAMKRRAAAAMRAVLDQAGADDATATVEALDAFSRALLREGIMAWKGIGGADGKPIPVTPDNVEMFLAEDRLFAPADLVYVVPILNRDREKNGSSASRSGTGKAGTRGKAIAPPSATPRSKGGARNARTASTRSKPSKAKKSGRS